jgi:hypothetical protein
VFHPTRLGKYLAVFFLIHTRDSAPMVKNNKPGTGGTLIQSAYEFAHFAVSVSLKYLMTGFLPRTVYKFQPVSNPTIF